MSPRRRSAWRWALDPRDPEHEDPPEHVELDDFEEPLEPAYDYDGPQHYIPPYEP